MEDGLAGSSEAKASPCAAASAAAPRSRPSLRVVTRSSSGGGGGKAGSDDDDEFHDLSNASPSIAMPGASPSPRLGGGRGTPRTPPPGPGLAAALSVGIEAGGDGLKKKEEGGEKKKSGEGASSSSPKEPSPPPAAASQQPLPPAPAAADPASSSGSPDAAAGPPPPSPGDALFRVKDLDTGRELKVRTVRFRAASRVFSPCPKACLGLSPSLATSSSFLTFQKKTLRTKKNRGTPSGT